MMERLLDLCFCPSQSVFDATVILDDGEDPTPDHGEEPPEPTIRLSQNNDIDDILDSA